MSIKKKLSYDPDLEARRAEQFRRDLLAAADGQAAKPTVSTSHDIEIVAMRQVYEALERVKPERRPNIVKAALILLGEKLD